ncbi:MAG: hypothetical protein GY799_34375 [Desulfobulbaceae bacterium]|nr:hypothetical protein [Desulfobulbaceae bacterium]
MNLNDPFGRLESRHQIGYESMRDTMRSSGIDTPQAAQEFIKKSKKRGLKFLVMGLALLVPLILLLPKAMPVTISLALFFAVWVVKSNISAQRYIQRYIDEDLK